MENNRRFFLKQVGFLGSSLLLAAPLSASAALVRERRIGVIGLDTSHSEMFTRDINQGALSKRGYRVVAAYPHGSKDIPSALAMKANIIAAVRKMGVRVVDTIDQLLEEVDFVLLESNDGRVHLEQAKKVIAAKKPFFIDKPMAQNLGDVEQIFSLANDAAVPVFP